MDSDPTAERREAFQLEFRGQTYACERIIRGNARLTQQIVVAGVGSRLDRAAYGAGAHAIGTMPNMARIIAVRIVEDGA